MKSNLINSFKKLALALAGFFGSTTAVLAQDGITNPVIGELGDDVGAAQSGSLFARYFVQVWGAVISVGALIVIVMFLWGALEWITAGGDIGKVQEAQKRIMNAAIGLFLLVASFAIIEFISLIFFGGEFSIL